MDPTEEVKQASQLPVNVTPVPGTAVEASAAKAPMPSSSHKMLNLKTPSPRRGVQLVSTSGSTLKPAPIDTTLELSKTVLALLELGQGQQLKVVTNESSSVRPFPNSKSNEPFPLLAIRMINEVSETHPEIMHWSPDGEAFVINDRNGKTRKQAEYIIRGYCSRTYDAS